MSTAEMGRPRDTHLDDRIIAAARELMSEGGVDALSFGAVADRAATTRPAIYRRYADKTALAVAAVASLAQEIVPSRTGDVIDDLVAELASFRSGLTSLNGMGIVGAVLSGSTDSAIAETYRSTVVAPRRQRIAAILDEAVDAGELSASPADRQILVAMCTGSWYGFALAGTPPPRSWPKRTAALVWAAAGSVPR